MALKRLYHSVSCARAAFYSAFGSPNLGITWAVVTFLSGLFYLIYNQHRRQIVAAEPKNDAAELDSGGEDRTIEAHP